MLAFTYIACLDFCYCIQLTSSRSRISGHHKICCCVLLCFHYCFIIRSESYTSAFHSYSSVMFSCGFSCTENFLFAVCEFCCPIFISPFDAICCVKSRAAITVRMAVYPLFEYDSVIQIPPCLAEEQGFFFFLHSGDRAS